MELQLNKEGIQYILGLPVKDDPALFSQVIVAPGELKWLPPEMSITGFSSLDDAQRAKEELQDRLGGSPCVYQVTIDRLATEEVAKS